MKEFTDDQKKWLCNELHEVINKSCKDNGMNNEISEKLFELVCKINYDRGYELRTSIGFLKQSAEFLHKHFPDPQFNNEYIRFSKQVFDEIIHLEKLLNL
jgi:hypothetical protein